MSWVATPLGGPGCDLPTVCEGTEKDGCERPATVGISWADHGIVMAHDVHCCDSHALAWLMEANG